MNITIRVTGFYVDEVPVGRVDGPPVYTKTYHYTVEVPEVGFHTELSFTKAPTQTVLRDAALAEFKTQYGAIPEAPSVPVGTEISVVV